MDYANNLLWILVVSQLKNHKFTEILKLILNNPVKNEVIFKN